MWPFEYNGQKAMLITTDDFMQRDMKVGIGRGISDRQYWRKIVQELKDGGYVYVLVVTSFSAMSIAEPLRDCFEHSNTKNAYFGQLSLGGKQ